ncbi:MAG: hypothetical protein FWE32_01695 [Oscillospiraceae bacterium]|nr:hypothetical protein [Oscillospiraceae bacterium]
MKKITRKLAILLAIALLTLTACERLTPPETEEEAPDQSQSAPAAPVPPVTLPETIEPEYETPVTLPGEVEPEFETPVTLPETVFPVPPIGEIDPEYETPVTLPDTIEPEYATPVPLPETITP